MHQVKLFAFLEIARLVDILHVAGPARESIPAIPVGELPRWSKSVEVRQGIENLPYYRHRIAELLESLPLRRDERYDVALASGRRWVMPMTMRAVSGAS